MDFSGIFYFFCSAGGEGGVRCDREGGSGRFLIENCRGGGSPKRGGGRGGPEGLHGIWGGGGVKFFLFGAEIPKNLFGLILTSKGYFNFSGYLK